jgi:hypothetical protein
MAIKTADRTFLKEAINSEACKVYNIDISSLITGAIVGSAQLHDV